MFVARSLMIIIIINIFFSYNVYAQCSRIVSLAPSITETLFYMNLGRSVVGVTRYAKWPKAVKDIPKIGGYYDINLESIINRKPDIVMLTYRQVKLAEKIRKLHIKTLVLHYGNIRNIIDSINIIGEYCNAEVKANNAAGLLKKQIDNISKKYKNSRRRKILICFGYPGISPIIAAGNRSIYGDIIRIIGARNVYQGSLAWPDISLSNIINLNPYAVFVLGSSKMDNKSILSWNRLPIDAAAHHRVYLLEQNIYITPSPRIVQVIKNIAKLLYK